VQVHDTQPIAPEADLNLPILSPERRSKGGHLYIWLIESHDKAGKFADLSGIQFGQPTDMMQIASVVSANVEA